MDGCRTWTDWQNVAGGVKVGGDSYETRFVACDNEYGPGKARTGATRLIREDDIKFIMMPGGDSWPGLQLVAERTGMLFSTLLPAGFTPETTMLPAPAEVHPGYDVTGVDWLRAPDQSSGTM